MTALTPPAIAAALEGLIRAPHPVLARLGAEAREHGQPTTDALTGGLLHGLARAIGATRVLEIGTGTGAATIWLATALPATGLLVTLERDPRHATSARVFIAEAGLDDRVNVMIGEADRYLHKIAGPFDLVVQDGDAALFAPMLEKLDRLLRPGGTLVTPRALTAPDGFADRLSADPRFTTHWLPIADGVAVSVKRA